MKDYSKIKCIVPVSGGKDSQCCLKMAVEEFGPDSVLGLFCDTKFEHPKTYQHVKNISKLYGVEICTINGGDVVSESIKNGRFPSGTARFCTDKLKIRETKLFLKEFSERFAASKSGTECERTRAKNEQNDTSIETPMTYTSP